MSWNESPEMSRESTRVGVIPTARAITDFDVDGLPGEQISCRLARGFSPYCNKERQSKKRPEPPIVAHVILPSAPAHLRLSGFGIRQAALVNALHGRPAQLALAQANPPP